MFGREVISLTLIDPRFYHLDTALAVLDPVEGVANGGPERANIAYLPGGVRRAQPARSSPSASPTRSMSPTKTARSSASTRPATGYNVIISPRATGFETQLRERGYNPILVDLSELLLGGGGIEVLHPGAARSGVMTAPQTLDAARRPSSPPKSSTSRTTTTRCRWWSPTAEGAWVTDVDGKRYLDCLAGYSALNFGHGHPALLAAAHEQLDRLTLTSRAFHNDQLGAFCRGSRPSCAARTWCCR